MATTFKRLVLQPFGAREVIRLKELDRVPGPIVVSLIGELTWPNLEVHCHPGKPYDFAFLQGLPVFLAADSKHHPGRVLTDLVEADPLSLSLVDMEQRRGAEVFKIHGVIKVLPWLPQRNEEFEWT